MSLLPRRLSEPRPGCMIGTMLPSISVITRLACGRGSTFSAAPAICVACLRVESRTLLTALNSSFDAERTQFCAASQKLFFNNNGSVSGEPLYFF